MAFGDSLTEGQVSPAPTLLMRLVSPQAYPGRLQAMLVERYTAQTPVVINQGMSGERAEDGASRFVRAIRNDNPEAVLLLEGINDISAQGAARRERGAGGNGLDDEGGAQPPRRRVPGDAAARA